MSHDPSKVFIDALEARNCSWRGHPWKGVAQCPAHEDRSPSLSFAEGVDGRVVLHCFAGCDPDAIVRALELSWADLFPDGHRAAPRVRRPKLVSEPLLVTAERVLAASGITYRYTTAPDLIVADLCPACLKPELWIHDAGKQLQASCWNAGCESADILAALSRSVTVEEVADAA